MEKMEFLLRAKYHLSIARNFNSLYISIKEKRAFLGVLKELEKSAYNLIIFFLMLDNLQIRDRKNNIMEFSSKISVKYLNDKALKDILRIFEIKKDLEISPIVFLKEDNLLLLVNSCYKVLTFKRLTELLESLDFAIRTAQGLLKTNQKV